MTGVLIPQENSDYIDLDAEIERVAGGGGSQPIQSGSGSPIGVVTPLAIGYLYVDLANDGALYQATGAANTDWVGVGGDIDTSGGYGVSAASGTAAMQGEAAGGGAGGSASTGGASGGDGGNSTVQAGSGAAGHAGGTSTLKGGDGDAGNHGAAALVARGGTASDPGRVQITTDNAGSAPYGTGNAGEVLTADGAFGSIWAGAQFAAGVPMGAPTGLPIAVDTTAVSGGIYVWNGAAWVKAASI